MTNTLSSDTGKVIDEIFRVLRFIQTNPQPPRIAELLQELRDISSMAMEFFEERIVPNLKTKMQTSNALICRSASLGSYTSFGHRAMLSLPSSPTGPSYSPTPSTSTASSPISNQEQISTMRTELRRHTQSIQRLERIVADFRKHSKDVEKQLREVTQSQKDLQAEVTELRKSHYQNDIVMDDSEPLPQSDTKAGLIPPKSAMRHSRPKKVETSPTVKQVQLPKVIQKKGKPVSKAALSPPPVVADRIGVRRSTRSKTVK